MEELFENLRSMQKKAGIFTALLIFSIIAAVISFSVIGPGGFIFVGAAIVCGIIAAKNQKKYTAYFKESFVRSVLSECGFLENVSFDPGSGISYETVEDTDMMFMGDRFSSNDLITASYKGVNFVQSDIDIEEVTHDSKGNTEYITVFRGRWATIEFNKNVEADIQIVSKYFSAAKRGGSGFLWHSKNGLKKVELESAEFNKAFTVYASDTQQAFYVLTPHFMEALIRLADEARAPVMLMFSRGVFHIAIYNGKDAFEPKTFGKIDVDSEKERILADIRVITDFIDGLNLDRDIYKY